MPNSNRPMVALLETELNNRLSGRVRDLRLTVHADGIVLSGRAPSYYAKQLAQHAVMDAIAIPILANDIQVYRSGPAEEPSLG